MITQQQMSVTCPACRHSFMAAVDMIVDAAQNPDKKGELVTERLNVLQCPNCGTQSAVSTPILYHDSSKELLITFVPMDLGLSDDESEKMIGRLMRELTDSMPNESMKAYIFQPRRAFTKQGLIEQVLEADGVTKEMMDEQKERARLVQLFLQADEETLTPLVEEHDERIDVQFFQTMSAMAQRMLEEGRPEVAQQIMMIQQRVAELSTQGQELIRQGQVQEQIVVEVAEALQDLAQNARPSPEQLIDLVQGYADDDDRLQAVVGLARPLFDYTFFQELTAAIGRAPANEREQLEALRQRLLDLTAMIDQQQQMTLQAAANLLREMLNSDQPQQFIAENLDAIDDTFMAVLNANVQEAERQGDTAAAGRLKALQQQVLEVLQSNMQPEVRFINELLSAESEAAAEAMIRERASEFGPALLEVIDALGEMVAQRGEQILMQKLQSLREVAEEVLR